MDNEKAHAANPAHGETGHVHGPDCGHDHGHDHGAAGHVHGPWCNHGHDHHHHHDHGVQEPYMRRGPKIGRNDPCPCGSGQKYKKCCMG
ncbi:MAG: SEC-C metal-binding domain-containing protein [Hyphomicrobiaceae bacterium]